MAAFVLATSCSKDDDPNPAKDVENTYTAEKLVVTNGGVEVVGSTIKLVAKDNASAELSLEGIINGHSTFTMDVNVIQTKAEYSFSGSKQVSGMDVKVAGSIVDGKATVTANVEMTSPEILKTWGYNLNAEQSLDCFNLGFANKSGKVMFGGKEIPSEEFTQNVDTWVNIILGMTFQDLKLSFAKDGYVGVEGTFPFAKDDKGNTVAQKIKVEKLARYYYNPTNKLLSFDIPLGDLLKSKADGGSVFVFPLVCTFNNDKLQATLPYELAKALIPLIPTGATLDAFLEQLKGLLPSDMAMFFPVIKTLITDTVNAITDKDLTNLTLTAKLQAK